jgi:hypothetical protein
LDISLDPSRRECCFRPRETSLSRRSNAALLAAYDLGRFRAIVDVGRGNGALLAAVLAAYADVQGMLFDQPHVVTGVASLLEGAGVANRCRTLAGRPPLTNIA